MYGSMQICVLSMAMALWVSCCSASRLPAGDAGRENLADCPSRPNCVSSEAKDPGHAIKPLHLNADRADGWAAITAIVGQLPRSKVVEASDVYLHVECKSRLFGFVDDLELLLDPATAMVAIRSAARVGYSDLGVNRRRVEALRQKLMSEGLID
jgi:uncharacterized protein (DUF1499 family)